MKKLKYYQLLALLTALVIGALGVRTSMNTLGAPDLKFLTYNLSLGFAPLLIAWLLKWISKKAGTTVIIVGSFLWLVFYPNAPYMVTDTIHVRGDTTILDSQYYQLTNVHVVTALTNAQVQATATPISSNVAIYDSIIIFLFAMLSMFYGFYSLKIVRNIWTQRFGDRNAFIMTIFSIVLSGLGIYVGRMASLRLNTTDLFKHPGKVVHVIMECLFPLKDNFPTYAFIFLFSLIQFGLLALMRDFDEPVTAQDKT